MLQDKNKVIYSPYRVRECIDLARRFPVEVQKTGFGFQLTRKGKTLDSKPMGTAAPPSTSPADKRADQEQCVDN